MFAEQREPLRAAQREARLFLTGRGKGPGLFDCASLRLFLAEARGTLRLIREEPEIVTFALLQWLVLAAAFLLWRQALDWMPDAVWYAIENSRSRRAGEFKLVAFFLLCWSFVVVAVASYPLSLLNAAIVAAHYLRHAGEVSTVGRCLTLAARHLDRLWAFFTLDSWNTLMDRSASGLARSDNEAALDPATSADEDTPGARRIWQAATFGMLPALIAGHSPAVAAQESVALLRAAPERVLAIRAGYRSLFWAVTLLTFSATLGAVAIEWQGGWRINWHDVFLFNVVPVFVSAAVILVFVRPFFVLVTVKLYTDCMPVEATAVTPATSPRIGLLALLFFLLLAALMIGVLFEDEIGLRAFVERLAAQDLDRYRRLLTGS